MTLEDIVAEGDKVVARFTFRGTHQGEFLGIAPTDKQVTGIKTYRMKDGKVSGALYVGCRLYASAFRDAQQVVELRAVPSW